MVKFTATVLPPSGVKSFVEGVDNVKSRITKEDRLNTDIMELWDIPPTTEINIGDEVYYYDSTETLLFHGIVEDRKIGSSREATVYDLGAQLLHRTVNEVFTNQSPEAIFESVITNYSNLTFLTTIASGVTISSYDGRGLKAWDICQEMADLLLANFKVDKNGLTTLELEGDTISSKSINTTDWVLAGKWKEDKTKLVNSLTVEADDLIQEKSESFAGPGTTFTLAEIPIQVHGVTVGGTPKTGYVAGSSTGDYQLKKGTKDIVFDASSSTVVVNYTYRIPINPSRQNFTSIQTYGQHDEKIKIPYIVSREDARKYCEYYINKFKNPLKSGDWISKTKTNYDDFESFIPNNLINVNDNIYGVTGLLQIQKVVRENPGTLTVTVGDNFNDMFFYQKALEKRVKQLESETSNATIANPDELIEETKTATITVSVLEYKKRPLDNAFYLSETDIPNAHMSETDNGIYMKEEASLPAFSNVTNTGSALVSNYIINNILSNVIATFSTTITHIAVGDNNTEPAITDTVLGNETYREAVNDTSTSTLSIEFSIFLDTTEDNGNNILETGLFDSPAAGTMYAHSLTNSIAKTATVEVYLGYRITFSVVQT